LFPFEAQPGDWHAAFWHTRDPQSLLFPQALPSGQVPEQAGVAHTSPTQLPEPQSVLAPQ